MACDQRGCADRVRLFDVDLGTYHDLCSFFGGFWGIVFFFDDWAILGLYKASVQRFFPTCQVRVVRFYVGGAAPPPSFFLLPSSSSFFLLLPRRTSSASS